MTFALVVALVVIFLVVWLIIKLARKVYRAVGGKTSHNDFFDVDFPDFGGDSDGGGD